MVWPSTLSSFTDPSPTDRLSTTPHSSIETAQNNGIRELQAFVGTNASAVGTLIYNIRATASDGGGHVQTANKGGTGQTTYAKGDLLVATSSSVLAKLAVSSVEGYALVSDSSQAAGMRWGIPGNVPTTRIYSSVVSGGGGSSFLGIWNKPSTLSYVIIEAVAAGAGGGGTTTAGATGGGGAGGYARIKLPFASLPVSASIIVGSGGDGGAGAGGDGGKGGNTVFGSILNCIGGAGGTTSFGGLGGSVLGGDINIPGGDGGAGAGTNGVSGAGGASYFGGGGRGGVGETGQAPGRAYGSGGGGNSSDGDDAAGAAGANGIIIITEY